MEIYNKTSLFGQKGIFLNKMIHTDFLVYWSIFEEFDKNLYVKSVFSH